MKSKLTQILLTSRKKAKSYLLNCQISVPLETIIKSPFKFLLNQDFAAWALQQSLPVLRQHVGPLKAPSVPKVQDTVRGHKSLHWGTCRVANSPIPSPHAADTGTDLTSSLPFYSCSQGVLYQIYQTTQIALNQWSYLLIIYHSSFPSDWKFTDSSYLCHLKISIASDPTCIFFLLRSLI